MSGVEIAKIFVVIYFIAIGGWFAMAQPHFDRSSRKRPLLMVVLALSLALAIVTVTDVLLSRVPAELLIVAVTLATAAALIFHRALNAIARKNLGLAFSGIVPSEVVRRGPYRVIRHPLYTAYSVFWISCALLSSSWPAGVLAAAIIGLYIGAARSEEADIMRSPLGVSYARYRRSTGMIFPRLFGGKAFFEDRRNVG